MAQFRLRLRLKAEAETEAETETGATPLQEAELCDGIVARIHCL